MTQPASDHGAPTDAGAAARRLFELRSGPSHDLAGQGEARRQLEGTIPVAQQHAHVATARVGGHQVELAVAVEVARRQGAGAGAGCGSNPKNDHSIFDN